MPNCGVTVAPEEGRLGRRCLVPPMARGATARVRTIREQTFQVHGPRLFNCLPAYIRNTTKALEEFKMKLDKFLETMPDEPRMDGLTPGACTDTCWTRPRGWPGRGGLAYNHIHDP